MAKALALSGQRKATSRHHDFETRAPSAPDFPRPLGERFPLAGAETASPEFCLGVVDGFGEAETAAFLQPWPHRRLFLGASVEAWLIGLTSDSPALAATFTTAASITVTSGRAHIRLPGNAAPLSLTEGQGAAFQPHSALRIATGDFADVLLLLTNDHLATIQMP